MRKISIIRWNDDNHAERVWVNGHYIGDMSDPDRIFTSLIDIINKGGYDYYQGTCVWGCDDFDKYREDFENEDDFEEWLDNIYMWFNDVNDMTDKQIELIENSQFDILYKDIMEEE